MIYLREGIIWRGSEWNLEAAASCGLQCSETHHQLPLRPLLFHRFTLCSPLVWQWTKVENFVPSCPFPRQRTCPTVWTSMLGSMNITGRQNGSVSHHQIDHKQNISRVSIFIPRFPSGGEWCKKIRQWPIQVLIFVKIHLSKLLLPVSGGKHVFFNLIRIASFQAAGEEPAGQRGPGAGQRTLCSLRGPPVPNWADWEQD